jgi:hypothetical protein
MPDWPKEQRTHYQMYETTTEGTPISPVMDSPESLARWLVDNNAASFGPCTATYEQWLGTILSEVGVVAAIIEPGKGLRSGVEVIGQKEYNRNQSPDVVGEGE